MFVIVGVYGNWEGCGSMENTPMGCGCDLRVILKDFRTNNLNRVV
jgi:hypothetical protein